MTKTHQKRGNKDRNATPEEILFIFQKTLQHWKPVKIYNVLIQQNNQTHITRRDVDNIYKGNTKIYPHEVSSDVLNQYKLLRQHVYEYHQQQKLEKHIS